MDVLYGAVCAIMGVAIGYYLGRHTQPVAHADQGQRAVIHKLQQDDNGESIIHTI